MHLVIRLRKIRETYKLTQGDIAYKCDITPSAYGQIERKADAASFTTLKKIADAIGISISFLVDIDNPNYLEKTSYNLFE
jgi:transcriptional regulator with XRE-family HTH domain